MGSWQEGYLKEWGICNKAQLECHIYSLDWPPQSPDLNLDWPIVQSGPRPWVFWGLFLRLDHMVQSQNGSVSKVFFRLDCLVQSNLYGKMGTVSETGLYGLCQEQSHLDWTIWSQ